LTIMITPFMSCGARLPIYALFAGTFFVANQGLVVFSMYFIGLIVAIASGVLLKKLIFKGEKPTFIMELPPYRVPGAKSILLHTWEKSKGFIIKAGTIIFSMSILIWILQNFDFSLTMVEDNSQSIIAYFGRWISPIFTPLGFGTWQACVALIAGLIAKEAVVSSISGLYAVGGITITAALTGAFTPLSAFSYMIFCLLYMPCISAFITVKKEMNSWKWAFFSAGLQTGTAYVVSLLVYQIGSLFIK
ncbi:MAG: ferrous iron transporter B, partial [Oscillospiraceae bacterium]